MALSNEAAMERAEALGDKESQATAHAELWRATGNRAHLDTALTLYGGLGDKAAVEQLQAEVNP